MADFNSLDDIDLKGKKVLVRTDLNVPTANGVISDTTRLERIEPTLRTILDAGGIPILLSHFGRPKGQANPAMSLAFVADGLSKLLGIETHFLPVDWSDVSTVPAQIDAVASGQVIVLENTRFDVGEETNDDVLAARMASLGDIYVNDAFSTAHRAHASTEALAHLLPNAAGRAMQAELEALEAGLGNPDRPVIAIVGGAKVSTKMELLENLIVTVDILVIGGGMANTFLYAQGHDVGSSLCEKNLAETARRVMSKAAGENCEIVLPSDAIVAREFKANAQNRIAGLDDVAEDEMILDVGPDSITTIIAAIDRAKTLIWNGPLGAFELTPFDRGTMQTAHHVAARTKSGHLVSVAGGGDTVAALSQFGVKSDMTYVSTAGGAFLEWMEGKTLPGVAALSLE